MFYELFDTEMTQIPLSSKEDKKEPKVCWRVMSEVNMKYLGH
jgi:hypothetical protein